MTDPSVTEKPIIFSGPMIRALLARRKTMTRRLVKPQPAYVCGHDNEEVWAPDERTTLEPKYPVGTRLWVREKWRPQIHPEIMDCIHYAADGAYIKPDGLSEEIGFRFYDMCNASSGADPFRSPIFMPRWAARIFLTVTAVKCERVNAISEEDARAEGIMRFTKDDRFFKFWPCDPREGPMRCAWQDLPHTTDEAFAALWDSLHGPGAFARGEWVFAYTLGEE